MSHRRCTATTKAGRPCGATPLTDEPTCFWHSPGRAEEVEDARRLGGLRRRREKVLANTYDLVSLDDVEGLRRLTEIAVFDTIGLENTIARSRVLLSAATVGMRLLETGELEARLAAVEAALRIRADPPAPTLPDSEPPRTRR